MPTVDDTYRFMASGSTATGSAVDYRSEYSRDYARVLHSPSFRRLENKTQLFPGQESDFFRNRLTHSLEVSQIARSIAEKLLQMYPGLNLVPDVCEIAGLIHDLGHPPFGHNGEAALDKCMLNYGGFEGNAQTIRIITRLEKKEDPGEIIDSSNNDCRVGLNLTARVIASALKYDKVIPVVRRHSTSLVKGYYQSESTIIGKVKASVIGGNRATSFKTIECGIMDVADDIAYSTYDVEDAFKAGFLTPYDILSADSTIFDQIVEKLDKDNIHTDTTQCRTMLVGVFADVWEKLIAKLKTLDINQPDYDLEVIGAVLTSYRSSKTLAQDGYKRNKLTSMMVNSFINGVKIEVNNDCPVLSRVYLDDQTKLRVNVLKHFSYVALINSARLKVAENRGREIVEKMFNKLFSDGGYRLLPEDFQYLYQLMPDELSKARVVCDFIAGMTDRYALEFYGRLFSENPQSIFIPL